MPLDQNMLCIDFDTPVREILNKYPETASVFTGNGIDTTRVDAVAIGQILSNYHIHPGLFMGRLHDAVDDAAALQRFYKNEKSFEGLDFLGKAAFYVRPQFSSGVENLIRRHNSTSLGKKVTYVLPTSGNHAERDMSYIWYASHSKYFPNMVCSVGLSNLFRRDFYRRFIKSGIFAKIDCPMLSEFEQIGFRNPESGFTPYAIVPWIFMIDLRRLGNLPVPQKLEDLLNPIYKRNILIEGGENKVANVPTLYVYQRFGLSGLRSFARNVKETTHPVNMFRYFDCNDERGAAISIVPWTFAKASPYHKDRMFVWPQDGALSVPMYFLIKDESAERLRFLSDYLVGEEFGRLIAECCCPSLSIGAGGRLPEGATFQWLGWDFIHSEPERNLSEYTRDQFAHYFTGV